MYHPCIKKLPQDPLIYTGTCKEDMGITPLAPLVGAFFNGIRHTVALEIGPALSRSYTNQRSCHAPKAFRKEAIHSG